MAASRDTVLSFAFLCKQMIEDFDDDVENDDEEMELIISAVAGKNKLDRENVIKIQGYFENVNCFLYYHCISKCCSLLESSL